MARLARLTAGLALCLLLPAGAALAKGVGYYPGGQLLWEYLYQDGEVREAKWYDEQGRLTARTLFQGGRQVMSEGYRSDGSLEWQARELGNDRQEVIRFAPGHRSEMRFELAGGQPDGPSILFYPNGQARQSVTFRKGIPDGTARSYFENGQVESEYAYRDGKLDGPCRIYAPDGKPVAEHHFRNGLLQ